MALLVALHTHYLLLIAFEVMSLEMHTDSTTQIFFVPRVSSNELLRAARLQNENAAV